MSNRTVTLGLCCLLLIASTNSQGMRGPPGDTGVGGEVGETGATGPTGATGLTGPTGESGPTGGAGPAGVRGPKGQRGQTGPTGDKGDKGVQGATGETGDTGATGPFSSGPCSGPVGPPGQPGSPGDTGGIGAWGQHGKTGKKGEAGATGVPGPAYSGGENGVGDPGQPGEPGDAGQDGAAGPTGDTGSTGATGKPGLPGRQQVYKRTGTSRRKRQVGCRGPKGPSGATGATGATGPTGWIGSTGQRGDKGATGPRGADGQGLPGSTGLAGHTGIAGRVGATGATGATGHTGAKGSHGPVGLPALRDAPSISDIQPVHGSASGDTVVTVTGSRLDRVPLHYVHFNGKNKYTWKKQHDDQPSSATSGQLLIETPAVDDDFDLNRNLSVELQFANQLYIGTQLKFMFYRTINVPGVPRTDHLTTGGTRLTLEASNIAAGTTPVLIVRVVISSTEDPAVKKETVREASCVPSYITQTAVCEMPALSLPSDFRRKQSVESAVPGVAASFRAGSRRADVFVGVRMSNPLSYRDVDAKLQFYPPPTIKVDNRIDVDSKTVAFTIEGENMRRGCRIDDYKVSVGKVELVKDELQDNRLVVRMVKLDSYPRSDQPTRCPDDLYAVRVWVGHQMTEYGCLKFKDAKGGSAVGMSDNTKLIIGLCVGLGALLLIIIIVVIIVVCVVRSRRSRKEGDTTMSYNNLRSDSASTVGTTRSFDFGSEHLNDKPELSVNVSQY